MSYTVHYHMQESQMECTVVLYRYSTCKRHSEGLHINHTAEKHLPSIKLVGDCERDPSDNRLLIHNRDGSSTAGMMYSMCK